MELATPPDDSQPALAIESSGLLLGEYQAKAELIAAACESGDVSAIARLSTEAGGLLNDTLRKAACATGVPTDNELLLISLTF